ncbi:MAG TPA: Ig-like domain-containing protein [Gemmatimonadales bacterium]
MRLSPAAARRPSAIIAILLLAALPACADVESATGVPGGQTPSRVSKVTVSPDQAQVAVKGTTQLSVEVRDAGGAVVSGDGVTWRSLEPELADVIHGFVIGKAPGEARIVASVAGVADTARVSVIDAPGTVGVVARVTLDRDTTTVLPGATAQLTATPVDAYGTLVAGAAVSWKSENSGVATVSATGMVTGVAPGTTRVVASASGHADTVTVTVAPPPVASVELVAAFELLKKGQTGNLSVVTRDARGTVLKGRAVTYQSSNTGVATVSTSGVVTAVDVGTAIITAASEGVSARVTVQVVREEVVVASVTVTPATITLDPGKNAALSAIVRDGSDAIIASYPVTWTSGSSAVATVSATGVVTAVAPGTATITASAGGKSASVTVTVTAPPPPIPVNVALDAILLGTVAEYEGAQFYLPDVLVAGEDDATGVAPMQAFVTYSLASMPAGAPVESARLTVLMDASGVFGSPFSLGSLVAERAATLTLATGVPGADAVLVTTTLRQTVSVDVTPLVRAARAAGETEITFRIRFATPRDVDGETDQLELAAGKLEVTYLK